MNREDRLHTTINSILYILSELEGKSDFLRVFKILYFAEMKHLSLYGRMFTDNDYLRLPNGPVPSYAYAGFKSLRGDSEFNEFEDKTEFMEKLEVSDRYMVASKVAVDFDELSESEVECLDISIEENKGLNFDQLSEKSHGSAWKSVSCNYKEIPLVEIAKEAQLSEEMINYSLGQDLLNKQSYC